MPELPEVETTLNGIRPHIENQKLIKLEIRHPKLRWPVPLSLKELEGEKLKLIERRGKYLLFYFKTGTMILHLGMSGRLSILPKFIEPKKHDHVDLQFQNKKILRFTDPRRFGALLYTKEDPYKHALLLAIGPEPFSKEFNGNYLFKRSRNKKITVKSFIMDSKVVAGVGNIYATEALFAAGILPKKAAGKINLEQYKKLAAAIKVTLNNAIAKGGTTLKDFMLPSGSPGYFSIELKVYSRGGEPCPKCHTTLKSLRIGQRSTVYCPHCQK